MNREFSILLIGTQITIGGAQRGLLDQARCFHAAGCNVVVAFLYDKDGLHQTWQQRSDFPICNLEAHKADAGILRNAGLFLIGLFKLWHLMRHERFDVVETFTPDSNLIGLPVAWLAGIPVRVATHRGKLEYFPRWRQQLHAWIVNSRLADVLVAVSEAIGRQARLEGINASKVLVIMNGVTPLDVNSVDKKEVRRKLNLKQEDLFLLAVGRLAYQKGYDILIDAVPALLQTYPHLTVNICGDGPQMTYLNSRILSLGLSNHVKLLGTWSNVAPLLAIADIFVLSSRFEGLSRALLEAMAAGVPVVATRVEGVDEVIVDGVHGLLIPAEDSVALSNALIQLLDDPHLRQRMGIAARDHILGSYTTDVMFKKYYDLMVNLLEGKARH